LNEVPFRDGRLTADIPATARIRIRAAGYQIVMKSVFMDYQPLLSSMLNTRSEQLGEWVTFQRTRELLRDVRLEFRMTKQ
jgi:hypothetical protein